MVLCCPTAVLSLLGACVGGRGLLPSLMHKPKTSSLEDSLAFCLLFSGGSQTIVSTKHPDSSLAKHISERFLKKSDFYLVCISIV